MSCVSPVSLVDASPPWQLPSRGLRDGILHQVRELSAVLKARCASLAVPGVHHANSAFCKALNTGLSVRRAADFWLKNALFCYTGGFTGLKQGAYTVDKRRFNAAHRSSPRLVKYVQGRNAIASVFGILSTETTPVNPPLYQTYHRAYGRVMFSVVRGFKELEAETS